LVIEASLKDKMIDVVEDYRSYFEFDLHRAFTKAFKSCFGSQGENMVPGLP